MLYFFFVFQAKTHQQADDREIEQHSLRFLCWTDLTTVAEAPLFVPRTSVAILLLCPREVSISCKPFEYCSFIIAGILGLQN